MRDFILITGCGRRVESLVQGRLQIDAPRWLATWNGAKVQLPRAPMLMVYHLANRPGIIRTRGFLYDAIDSRANDLRAVDFCIKKVRQAFRAVDPTFDQIEVILSEGYRWKA
jgi:DNA-binding response OmpR family regulator